VGHCGRWEEIGFSLGVVARRGAWRRVRLQAQVREYFVNGIRLLDRGDNFQQLLLRCSTSGIPAVVSGPPHFGQLSRSIPNTRLSRRAQ
jgi:hypothetical protein